ncbi:DUF4159 domain-containing protein [Xinfangfangia sp. D13-10-4-6]|uniref:DUF4159 domain-containing protein n=1 Tax=Pseudogemmobacter hezensis TaxID=2737662 RepID=UPI0015577AEA|nr:DUF4159 domain-containing protein [Pseudogemmobacter hezensis]NPD15977.1 DUF4159 domain-containing protein [Pseudogemmobacter hezensis]
MTFTFATVKYESGDWESAPNLPAALIDTLAKYTTLPLSPSGAIVELGSDEIFEYPFTFMTGHFPVRFTDRERANLRRYIDRGGFMLIDDHNHDIEGVFHLSVVEEMNRIFGGLEVVPNDHEIYRAFFTFEDGPPTTSHEMNGWGDQLVHEELFAVFRNGRIGLLYSNKDYSSEWDMRPESKRFMGLDPTLFGVNLVVYALSR